MKWGEGGGAEMYFLIKQPKGLGQFGDCCIFAPLFSTQGSLPSLTPSSPWLNKGVLFTFI